MVTERCAWSGGQGKLLVEGVFSEVRSPLRISGNSVTSVTLCNIQITKTPELRFHAVLGDGGREVRFERVTG